VSQGLPVRPPIAPMLGRLVRELPAEEHLYEPKWDGFRCLAFKERGAVELRSRHDRPLGRYFPEIAAALGAVRAACVVLDGELVVTGAAGPNFAALMSRLHPAASRVELLARETPATYVAFDVLAEGAEDLRGAPFEDRRRVLEDLLADAPPGILLSPQTDDRELAGRWLDLTQGGIDGVMAKRRDDIYEPGARRMLKVKLERTAECVVAGFRAHAEPEPRIVSLLLGLHDADGRLQHVGVAGSLGRRRGRELLAELRALVVGLEGHPWEHGYLVEGGPMGRLPGAAGRWTPDMAHDWTPLAAVRVCEVGYDHVEGARFRHPARFKRWRPDRDPASCSVDQLLGERS
jgi:ATP-dependent DNA ligase